MTRDFCRCVINPGDTDRSQIAINVDRCLKILDRRPRRLRRNEKIGLARKEEQNGLGLKKKGRKEYRARS